jgi:hypothetical protein
MQDLKTREAACSCGDLRLTLQGEPEMVSSCCCTRCQRRTGSLFGVTVYFRPAQMIAQAGAEATFHRSDGSTTFHFCPRCGSSVWWAPDEAQDVIGVAGGCFADTGLPSPQRMVWTEHRHPFVQPPEGIALYGDGPD